MVFKTHTTTLSVQTLQYYVFPENKYPLEKNPKKFCNQNTTHILEILIKNNPDFTNSNQNIHKYPQILVIIKIDSIQNNH